MENSTRFFEKENQFISTSNKVIAVLIALVFFTTSCSQYELEAPQTSSAQTSTGNDGGLAKSVNNSSVNNSGEIYFNSIIYINSFDYIDDASEYDPFIFAETGVKDYQTQTKLVSRLINYYDSLGYSVDRNLVNEAIDKYQFFSDSDAIVAGVNPVELNYAKEIRDDFENGKLSLSTFVKNLNTWKDKFTNDKNLSAASIERLTFNYNITIEIVTRAQANGALIVDDLDDVLPGMPCGWAVAGYAAAFIGLCAATGGVALAAGAVGFGIGIAGVMENC